VTISEHIASRRKWADSLVPDLDAPNEWITGYLWALDELEDTLAELSEQS
jgi:hypothetical protein